MEVDPLIDTNSDHRDGNEEEDDDGDSETHCDVASFAQVTYANLEPAQSVKQDPEETAKNNCKKAKQGKENFCHQCNHLFTNKLANFIFFFRDSLAHCLRLIFFF